MLIEKENNEIVVRFSAGKKASKIQAILDYLRYEELTAKSDATEGDKNKLMRDVKKGRFEKIKREIELDD